MVKMALRVVFVVAFVLGISVGTSADPLLACTAQEGVPGSANDYHLYLLDVGVGGDPIDITPADSQGFQSVWSPDGGHLLFSYVKDGEDMEVNTDLCIMDPDGKNPRLITNTPDLIESDPAWSPDGRSVAYLAGNPFKRRSVRVLNLNSGANQEIVPSEGNVLIKFTRLAWSPDGQQIAFDAFGPANLRGVYVVNVGSKQVSLLHRDLWATLVQDWLPSGELLVTSGEKQKLSLLRPGGGTEVLFPEVQEQFSYTGEARATWRRPDLFVFDTNMGTFRIKRDGTGLQKLLEGVGGGDLWTDSLDVPTPAEKLATSWAEVKAGRVR